MILLAFLHPQFGRLPGYVHAGGYFHVSIVKLSSAVLRLVHASASTASFYVMNVNDRLLKEVCAATKVELQAFIFLWDRVGVQEHIINQTYVFHIISQSHMHLVSQNKIAH